MTTFATLVPQARIVWEGIGGVAGLPLLIQAVRREHWPSWLVATVSLVLSVLGVLFVLYFNGQLTVATAGAAILVGVPAVRAFYKGVVVPTGLAALVDRLTTPKPKLAAVDPNDARVADLSAEVAMLRLQLGLNNRFAPVVAEPSPAEPTPPAATPAA